MPIPASGSQKDFGQLQTEFGGSNPIAMNEYGDKISLTVGTTSAHNIDQFSGLSAAAFPGSGEPTWFNTGGGLPAEVPHASSMGQSVTNTSFAQAGFNCGFQKDTTNDRIALRYSGYTSAAASSYSYAYVGYDGHDSTTFQAKCEYAVVSGGFVGSVQNPTSGSPASGTYANISTSSYSPLWEWQVTVNAGSGTRSLSSLVSGGNSPMWSVRAGSGTAIDGPNASGQNLSLSATRGTQGGGGGFGGICIHEDMLVSTQRGNMNINDIIATAPPKIWAWNKDTSQKELVDLLEIKTVEHDNLYKVNNIMVTEDHMLYTQNYIAASVSPAKTKEYYDVDCEQLAVTNRLMKEDGTIEVVTSIEVYPGTHKTYTLKTSLGNFYADGILVDSEI
jgi:hypothetical protein